MIEIYIYMYGYVRVYIYIYVVCVVVLVIFTRTSYDVHHVYHLLWLMNLNTPHMNE